VLLDICVDVCHWRNYSNWSHPVVRFYLMVSLCLCIFNLFEVLDLPYWTNTIKFYFNSSKHSQICKKIIKVLITLHLRRVINMQVTISFTQNCTAIPDRWHFITNMRKLTYVLSTFSLLSLFSLWSRKLIWPCFNCCWIQNILR